MFRIKIPVLLILLVMIFVPGSAQQKSLTSPWRFQSIANVGLLEGQAGSAFQLQTINGAHYKSWFAGVGLGLDYYRFRTIPLFIDIRKEFGRSNSKFFLYADGGINFSWVTEAQKMGYWVNDQFHNGFYSDMGLGIKTTIAKKSALYISLGYSYKKLSETYSTFYNYYPNYYTTDVFPPNDTGEKISYSLNRLSMKIGWAF
jgi:hypothetical protein